MLGRGIVGTVKLAATLVFAIPVGLMGVSFLLGDQQLLGAAFVGVAVLMVVLEGYLATPKDMATDVATEAARDVIDPDEDDG